jgi:hypothetical protein
LTAAHCIFEKNSPSPRSASASHFIFGANNIEQLDDDAQEIRVSRFILNPNWNPAVQSYYGDVALAMLGSDVQYNNFIRPVCLPSPRSDSHDIENRNASVAGWGMNFANNILNFAIYIQAFFRFDRKECNHDGSAKNNFNSHC